MVRLATFHVPAAGGLLFLLFIALFIAGAVPIAASQADEVHGAHFARLALDCVHREYPNKIAHVLHGDEDARPPRELTPAFYGCYDWHSSVHGHWLLARLARLHPDAETTAASRAALARSLTVANLQGEAEYMQSPGRDSFERPYGLAWLLQLGAELREWNDPDARRWQRALAPIESLAAEQIRDWLPKLTHPIRSGEHSQTAFAFGLILDWARRAGDGDMISLIEKRVADYYAADYDCPLRYEPSGQDFLSPCLAEADLLRRVTSPTAFADWLAGFLPGIPDDGRADWLEPPGGDRPDRRQARVHLDGLNLSRALDAGRDRRRAARGGRPPTRPSGRGRRRTGCRGLASVTGRHLRGRPLAGYVRHLSDYRPGSGRRPPPGDPPAGRYGRSAPRQDLRGRDRPAPACRVQCSAAWKIRPRVVLGRPARPTFIGISRSSREVARNWSRARSIDAYAPDATLIQRCGGKAGLGFGARRRPSGRRTASRLARRSAGDREPLPGDARETRIERRRRPDAATRARPTRTATRPSISSRACISACTAGISSGSKPLHGAAEPHFRLRRHPPIIVAPGHLHCGSAHHGGHRHRWASCGSAGCPALSKESWPTTSLGNVMPAEHPAGVFPDELGYLQASRSTGSGS